MTSLASSDIPSPMSASPDEPRFPTLELDSEQATAAGINDAKVGDTFTCQVKLRVKRIGDYGPGDATKSSVGVELMEIDTATAADDDQDKPDDAPGTDPATKRMFGPKDKAKKTVSVKDAGFEEGGIE